MEKLKIGVIGLSEGNGHPYSWSAIINGYEDSVMATCPFPVIPEYLSKEKYPDNFLVSDAEVSYVYTQDIEVSKHIATAARIRNVASSVGEMIGKVDAVLLARDDAENHFFFAKEILDAGIPIYIDKPIAHSVQDANKLLELQRYDAQIFTCSALRFAKEFHIGVDEKQRIGKFKCIQAYTPKSWEKYAIHVIEPLLCLLDFPYLSDFSIVKAGPVRRLSFLANHEIIVSITNLQTANHPLSIEIIGEKGSYKMVFHDSFYAFKLSLKEFINQVRSKRSLIPRHEVLSVISVIENGLK